MKNPVDITEHTSLQKMNKKPKPPSSKLPLPAAASTVKPKNEAPRPLFRRRSKSLCDLKSPANWENVAAKKPTIVNPVTTIPAKRPLERVAKRPATTKIEEKDAPKVAKVVKPAPYDYKARYMLEKEEHVKLKEKFKVMKSESMSEKLSNYDAISTRFEELKKCYDQKCVKEEELARINATLKIKCDHLEFEHKDLTDRYDGVCRSLQMIQCENDTLSRQNAKVEGDLRAAKDDICKRIEAIQKLKTKLGEMDDQRRRLHDEIQCLKVKSESGLMWPELIENDKSGEYLTDPSTAEEIHARLSHLCADTEQNCQNGATFNSQQVEECDFVDDKPCLLERISCTTHEVTHRIHLGTHPCLLSIQLQDNLPPALGLKHDVDVCLWQDQETDDWELKHVGTLLAFGYVQASKSQRKFLAAAPDLRYAIVCEWSRHIFVYCQNKPVTSGLLRNRTTGNRINTIAEQRVLTVPGGDILGVYPCSSGLYVLTTEMIV